jgi:hypothetical protein
MITLCRREASAVLPLAWLAFVGLSLPLQAASSGVQIRPQGDHLVIQVNGQPFAEYYFKSGSRPYLYPILGPGGLPMTRNWPMKEIGGEEQDHPHHRSFWWAHGDVNGVDFWSEEAGAGRIVHDDFLKFNSGPEVGGFTSRNRWLDKAGTLIATDERTFRFHNRTKDRIFDFEISIQPAAGELKFGDTKEGTMAIRLAETMRLKPNKDNSGKPTGHIVNSEGQRDADTWGRRAKWVDYFGPVQETTLGVAMFDHPTNPRHPTWWHVRDYGLFAANPFGIHDFEKKPAGTGNMVLPADQKLTFRYRIYIHRGDEREGQVAERYADYVRTTK